MDIDDRDDDWYDNLYNDWIDDSYKYYCDEDDDEDDDEWTRELEWYETFRKQYIYNPLD